MTDPNASADVMLSSPIMERILGIHGERGLVWLNELPRHLALIRERWALAEIGQPFAGVHAGLVAPVTDSKGLDLVLKIMPLPEWARCEAEALTHWSGRGAVSLIEVDEEHGALLLERAVPGDGLFTLCAADDRAATAAAAAVITELRLAPIGSAEERLPDISGWIDALQRPAAATRLHRLDAAGRRAAAVAADLLAGARRMLIHGDLHQHNILSARRAPWLAVDPKGVMAPPEAEGAALLRNPRNMILSHPDPISLISDRLDVLAERLGDDRQRLGLWAYVLAVVAAEWAFEDGEDEREVRCWLECADVLWRAARTRWAL